MIDEMVIDQLYVGRAGSELTDGTLSGMIKSVCAGPISIGTHGMVDDYHADRSVHGGADKALHQFPAEHYDRLRAALPQIQGPLEPGMLGENLSGTGVTEHDVHIGDVFAAGSVVIQVTQPRRPCWKIDTRLDCAGAANYVRKHGVTGWYYRVVAPGKIAAPCTFKLVERDRQAPSIADFQSLVTARRPPPAALESLTRLKALPEKLRESLRERADWLRRHS
ncbi:MAG: MOSC domain-containing protein [Gammaproteobacteria bacterium]